MVNGSMSGYVIPFYTSPGVFNNYQDNFRQYFNAGDTLYYQFSAENPGGSLTGGAGVYSRSSTAFGIVPGAWIKVRKITGIKNA